METWSSAMSTNHVTTPETMTVTTKKVARLNAVISLDPLYIFDLNLSLYDI